MNNYTDLGLSKQQSLIQKTNGSNAARDLYVESATMNVLARASTFESTVTGNGGAIGMFVYTVNYEFSGQKAPGLNDKPPIPLGLISLNQPQQMEDA